MVTSKDTTTLLEKLQLAAEARAKLLKAQKSEARTNSEREEKYEMSALEEMSLDFNS